MPISDDQPVSVGNLKAVIGNPEAGGGCSALRSCTTMRRVHQTSR